MTQQNHAGSTMSVLVNVIDSNGAHVDPDPALTTQVLDQSGADTGWAQNTPIQQGQGVYRIDFPGVATLEGELYTVMVSGGIGGLSWTPYGINVEILGRPVKEGVPYRWTNSGGGAGFDDVQVDPTP